MKKSFVLNNSLYSVLEGIAYHTHIPYDVVYAAAYGIYSQFSITLWAKLGRLYMEVKPGISLALINKLLELKDKCFSALHDV